jgi:hypothetical protein
MSPLGLSAQLFKFAKIDINDVSAQNKNTSDSDDSSDTIDQLVDGRVAAKHAA